MSWAGDLLRIAAGPSRLAPGSVRRAVGPLRLACRQLRIAPRLPAVLAIPVLAVCGVLAACNSDSDDASRVPRDVIVHPLRPGTSAASLGIQISPAVKPDFDLSIHDYVIDCTANPDAELSVADAGLIGFTYLGYTGHPQLQQPPDHVRFQQTLTLAPGQRMRFAISGAGSYSVRCLPPDFPPLSVSLQGQPQAEWYLFEPALGSASAYFVIMTDARGTPVWWSKQAAASNFDAKVLGPDTIAWSPPAPASGDGTYSINGTYVMRTFSGTPLNTLTGNLDFHDLQPTADGTYLALRYVPRICPPDCADMSPWGGSAQAGVTDAEIVELDENSNVVWSWRTRDHITLSETGDAGWFPAVANDIIHINAVEPDGPDGLMFSARHLNAIYRVIKSTGAIDWKIGGTHRAESLTVLGDLRPTANGANVLSGQHDVRRWPDGSISVHDNGTLVRRPPSVIRYRIDSTNRTAQVLEEIHDERVSIAPCCGSARLLPGGHWLVQWGLAPFMTELDSNSNPVLTIEFNMGTAFSYRAVPVLPGVVAGQTLRDAMDMTGGN